MMIEKRRLSGWTYEDRWTELDESDTHITPKYLVDYPTMKAVIEEVYAYFRDHLLNGEIPLEPVQGACMFCKYRPVCRFHGEERKAKILVAEDISLKKGKE